MLGVIILFSSLDCVRSSAMYAAIARSPVLLEALRMLIGDVDYGFLVRLCEVLSLAALIVGYLGVQMVWSASIGPLP